MDSLLFRDGVIGLPRPEYVAAPELLISSLAWRLFEVPELGGDDPRPVALTYRSEGRNSKLLNFIETSPRSEMQQTNWAAALRRAGIRPTKPDCNLGQGVADAIGGVRAAKAKGQAATPFAPGLAMLQNSRGILGKVNPPNLGLLLELAYSYGHAEYHSNKAAGTLAGRWESAVSHRLTQDRLLAAVEAATQASLMPGIRPVQSSANTALDGAGLLAGQTPFGWFFDAWVKLTSEAWVEALPARRWVDWATTVLRLGVGFAYLWEAAWYESVAREALRPGLGLPPPHFDSLMREVVDLIPWRDSRESTSVRDIGPLVNSRIRRGSHIRAVIENWRADIDDQATWAEGWSALRTSGETLDAIQAAMVGSEAYGVNVREAVRYSLLTRGETGAFADHYGLLRQRGRYLVVEPATEWIAVAASLSAAGPGEETNVGVVLSELSRLGLNPSLGELVQRLETAGLARGSADADQAVVVQCAY